MKPAISFDGYLTFVASYLADIHGLLLVHSIVASDVNVSTIHVAFAKGLIPTLGYRFRCHTRFAAERFVEYITRASNEYRDVAATAIIEFALGPKGACQYSANTRLWILQAVPFWTTSTNRYGTYYVRISNHGIYCK